MMLQRGARWSVDACARTAAASRVRGRGALVAALTAVAAALEWVGAAWSAARAHLMQPHAPETRAVLAYATSRVLNARVSLGTCACAAAAALTLLWWVLPWILMAQVVLWALGLGAAVAWIVCVPAPTAVAVAAEWDALLGGTVSFRPRASRPRRP